MTEECVFYGIGSTYVFEVQEMVQRLNWKVLAYIANQPKPEWFDLEPVISSERIDTALLNKPLVIPLMTPGFRQKLVRETTSLGFSTFASVIDPTSVVASRSTLSTGLLINCRAIVGASTKLGQFVSLNRGASVGHDCILDEFVSLGPGAVVCAHVEIGKGAFIGAGAIVNPRMSIGANAIIGAGSVVTKPVPANCLAFGNPARIVKEGITGYNDVAVE